MEKEQKKKIYSSLIGAVIFALILGQRHAGFALILFGLPLLIWMPYSLTIAALKPAIRRMQLIRVAVWVGAVSTVIGVHSIRQEMMRRDANEIVSSIKAFASKTGRYPENLEEIGVNRQALKEKLGILYYAPRDKPHLGYASTFNVFDMYDYDFEKGQWIFRPD